MDLGAYVPSFDNADGGGLVSTRADLDRFVRDLLEGRVLAPATVAVMLDTVPDGQGGADGLGIGTRQPATASGCTPVRPALPPRMSPTFN